ELDEELGLAAGFETVLPGATRLDDLVHEVALLVHLDGEHAAVAPRVAVLVDRALEALVQQPDAVLEDVREADEQRQIEPTNLQLLGELVEVDAPILSRIGPNID